MDISALLPRLFPIQSLPDLLTLSLQIRLRNADIDAVIAVPRLIDRNAVKRTVSLFIVDAQPLPAPVLDLHARFHSHKYFRYIMYLFLT